MAGENTERRIGLLKIKGCDNANRNGDVIFVHGLGDHPIKAWYPSPKEIEAEVDTDDFWENKLTTLNFWLNWLGQDRPDLGIWSYGYEAMPFKKGTLLSQVPQVPTGKASPIFDQASEFLEILQQQDILTRPRIFITHSLGGLIVKQTLSSACDYINTNHIMRELIGQTKGIAFLGTPHQGSDLANLQETFARIITASHLLDANAIITELRSDNTNTQLDRLRKWYSQNAKSLGIETKAFYEIQETNIPIIGRRIVVDRYSSDPSVEGCMPTAVNQADHFSLVKPHNQQNVVYIGVKTFINQYLPPRRYSPSVEQEQKEKGFFLTN